RGRQRRLGVRQTNGRATAVHLLDQREGKVKFLDLWMIDTVSGRKRFPLHRQIQVVSVERASSVHERELNADPLEHLQRDSFAVALVDLLDLSVVRLQLAEVDAQLGPPLL